MESRGVAVVAVIAVLLVSFLSFPTKCVTLQGHSVDEQGEAWVAVSLYGAFLPEEAEQGACGSVKHVKRSMHPIESSLFLVKGTLDNSLEIVAGLSLFVSEELVELRGENAESDDISLHVFHGAHGGETRRAELILYNRLLTQLSDGLSMEHWMRDMGSLHECDGCLGSLTLAEVAIPGSHDSGTFNLTLDSTVPPDAFAGLVEEACRVLNVLGISLDCNSAEELANKLTKPWAVTETTGWTGQLLRGARSFDYRGYYLGSDDTWVIQHSVIGSFPNTTAVALAEEVRAFLATHPEEIVIIEYKCANGNCTELAERFLTHLGPSAYHWTEGVVIPGNPTLAEMIGRDMRAILVEENDGQRANVTSGIVNDYPNACNLTQILAYDVEAIELFAGESAVAMRKIGYQVTAHGECIVRGFVGMLLESDSSYCVPYIGFDCSIELLGYIDQLNGHFSLAYVLNAYAQVKPISSAYYFGNLWNVDNITQSFASVIIALNAINLANRF